MLLQSKQAALVDFFDFAVAWSVAWFVASFVQSAIFVAATKMTGNDGECHSEGGDWRSVVIVLMMLQEEVGEKKRKRNCLCHDGLHLSIVLLVHSSLPRS
jgi:hypothetical protein